MKDGKSRNVYILCIAVVLLGGALFLYNVTKSFGGLGSTLTEYDFPGTHSVRLEEKGLYSLYRQYGTLAEAEDARSGAAVAGSSIVVLLKESAGGRSVELREPESRKRYRYMGKKGVKILEFENPAPSDYVLESFPKESSPDASYTLVIERGFEIKRLRGILLSQAFLLVPVLFAIILFMRTYIRN